MKTTKLVNELILGAIMIAPLMYFLIVWKSLPVEIPVHFDAKGDPNRLGSRYEILFTILFISLGTYLLLLYAPKIDPKKNFSIFSGTFLKLRYILTTFFAVMSFFIVSSVINEKLNISLLYAVLALLIALLGNYMSNIRPNYFLGIRTPWTLENESIWKKTHYITGRLWFFSGIILMIMMLLLPNTIKFYVLIGGILLLSVFPVLYSLITYRNREKR